MSAATVSESDLIIVGAGPAGLYGAYYAGFRGMTVTVIDALPHPGGQLAALYPEKKIFDVAGFRRSRRNIWSTHWSNRRIRRSRRT